MLILGEIAKNADLTVDEAELAEGFREMSVGIGQEPEIIRKYYEANNLLALGGKDLELSGREC